MHFSRHIASLGLAIFVSHSTCVFAQLPMRPGSQQSPSSGLWPVTGRFATPEDIESRIGTTDMERAVNSMRQAPASADSHSAGSVSVDQLRRPLSAKAARMLKKSDDFAQAGNYEKAIEQCKLALAKDPSSAPYVHSMLGVDYLKTQRYQEGAKELEQAVALLPHDSVDHSNFSYALAALGQLDRAEQEVRKALEIEPGSRQALTILAKLQEWKSAKAK